MNWNEIAALLNVVKECQGYPALKAIQGDAMAELNKENERRTPKPKPVDAASDNIKAAQAMSPRHSSSTVVERKI